ncbi:hypothetical protein GH733_002189 [Mirounga leonina]|nr:hypothetical protein GH733_002189 [Mirounga leonina]
MRMKIFLNINLSKYNLDASEEEDSNKKKSNRRSRSKSRSSHSRSSSHSSSSSSSRSRSSSHSRSSSSSQSRSRSSSRERLRSCGSKSRSSSRSHRGSSSPRKRSYSSSSSSPERNRKRSRSRSSSSGDRKKRRKRSRSPKSQVIGCILQIFVDKTPEESYEVHFKTIYLAVQCDEKTLKWKRLILISFSKTQQGYQALEAAANQRQAGGKRQRALLLAELSKASCCYLLYSGFLSLHNCGNGRRRTQPRKTEGVVFQWMRYKEERMGCLDMESLDDAGKEDFYQLETSSQGEAFLFLAINIRINDKSRSLFEAGSVDLLRAQGFAFATSAQMYYATNPSAASWSLQIGPLLMKHLQGYGTKEQLLQGQNFLRRHQEKREREEKSYIWRYRNLDTMVMSSDNATCLKELSLKELNKPLTLRRIVLKKPKNKHIIMEGEDKDFLSDQWNLAAKKQQKCNFGNRESARLNQSHKEHGLKYPAFIVNLIKYQVELNRKGFWDCPLDLKLACVLQASGLFGEVEVTDLGHTVLGCNMLVSKDKVVVLQEPFPLRNWACLLWPNRVVTQDSAGKAWAVASFFTH